MTTHYEFNARARKVSALLDALDALGLPDAAVAAGLPQWPDDHWAQLAVAASAVCGRRVNPPSVLTREAVIAVYERRASARANLAAARESLARAERRVA